MNSPIDEVMRDFAVNKLNNEIGTDDENEIFTTIKIFGWDLFRVSRNKNKNIVRLELKKYDKKKDYNVVRTFDFIGDKKE